MRPRRRTRTLSVALALSALVHFGALAWLWTRRAPPPPPVHAPLEVELYETVRPTPPTPTPPAPPTTAKVQRRKIVPPLVARKEPVRPSDEAQVTPPSPGPSGLPPDAPLRGSESAITLVPAPALPAGALDLHGGGAPSAQDQATRIVRELAAEHRRARQPPNEYFRELRQALEGLWQVEALVAARRVDAPHGDRARVRLVQAADGALVEVALVTAPQNAELGRGLLGDLQGAAATLPRPPPEVMQGRSQVASLWEFLLKPAPSVVKLSFDFDLVSLVDKHAVPKFTRKQVDFLLQEQ